MELTDHRPAALAARAGILDLLEALRDAAADPDVLRAEMRAWLRERSPESVIGRLAAKLLVDEDDLRELLENADGILVLLHGTAADLHARRFSLPLAVPLERNGDPRVEAWAGATIEGDGDGRLFDGLLRFDGKRKTAIRIGLAATASARLADAQSFSALRGSAAFDGGAEFVVDNVFLHDRDEPALDAVRADLASFLLPWQIDAATVAAVSDRVVHLGGSGNVGIGGTARWRDSIVRRIGLPGDGLVKARISSAASLSASASFTATLEGDFHVLVEPAAAGRLRVRLARSATSRRSARVTAGADLALRGVAPLARGILEELTADIGPLVASLAEGTDRFRDLHALFTGEIEERADEVLASDRLTRQIEEWLDEVRVRVDLRRRLRTLVARAAGAVFAEAIDAIEEEIGPAVEAVRRAIAPLHGAFVRIHEAIDAAARAKLGIALSRATRRTRGRESLFTFDIDPIEARAAFRQMLRGHFGDAFALAEAGSPAVRLTAGPFSRSGELEIRTGVDVTLLGRTIGAGSIFDAEWSWETSATGEVVIAAETSLEHYRRGWRSLGAVAARVEEDGESDAVVFEASIELEPDEPGLRAHEAAMIELGILDGPTTMMQDLPIEAKRFALRPFGRIESAAVLRLSREDARAIVEGQLPLARGTIARHLARWAPPPATFLRRRGSDRLPLFAWPSALDWARRPLPDTDRTLRFTDAARRVRVDVPAGAPLRATALYARAVLVFEALLRALAEWSRRDDGSLGAMRRAQKELIETAAPLLGFPSSAIGYALLGALIDLLPSDGGAETSLLIVREDRKRFLYPA